jgi:hypothetical protein
VNGGLWVERQIHQFQSDRDGPNSAIT